MKSSELVAGELLEYLEFLCPAGDGYEWTVAEWHSRSFCFVQVPLHLEDLRDVRQTRLGPDDKLK